ncbi:hypothetical protein [Acidisoma sp. L85]|uniref:hypothetical protein n=1 Tax=Acidisoma sp. L85 TaxID=1641850 RepID=UPI00131AA845|nr:hypothetical protein [Acidisoma sp. L85]
MTATILPLRSTAKTARESSNITPRYRVPKPSNDRDAPLPRDAAMAIIGKLGLSATDLTAVSHATAKAARAASRKLDKADDAGWYLYSAWRVLADAREMFTDCTNGWRRRDTEWYPTPTAMELWWCGGLTTGYVWRHYDWLPTSVFHGSYHLNHRDERASLGEIGKFLTRMGLKRSRRYFNGQRCYGYSVGDLEDARKAFLHKVVRAPHAR